MALPLPTRPCQRRQGVRPCGGSRVRIACAWVLVAAIPVQALATLMTPFWRPAHYHVAAPVAVLADAHQAAGTTPHDPMLAGHADPAANVIIQQRMAVAAADPPQHHALRHTSTGAHGHAHPDAQAGHAPHMHHHAAQAPRIAQAPSFDQHSHHDRFPHRSDGIGHHRHDADAADVVYVAGSESGVDPALATERSVRTTADSVAWLFPARLLDAAARKTRATFPVPLIRYRSARAVPLLRPPR